MKEFVLVEVLVVVGVDKFSFGIDYIILKLMDFCLLLCVVCVVVEVVVELGVVCILMLENYM